MSQGGFLSLRAALLAPDRVRALVLIDSQAGVEDPVRLPAALVTGPDRAAVTIAVPSVIEASA